MKVREFSRALEPRLYHACQLRDLELYADLGRIASRKEMFDLGDADRYTPFESDDFDVKNEHDESVFGNLSDGGNAYNKGRGMPNAYGPITLEFAPGAVVHGGADEIHIRPNGVFTRNAAGAQPVTTAAAVHQLYVDSDGFGRGEFEIVDGSLLLADAIRITVAPISVEGRRLVDIVRESLDGRISCDIVERPGPYYRSEHYARLMRWVSEASEHHGEVASLPDGLREWFADIKGVEDIKNNNLRRFANYLEHGTLSRMRRADGHLTGVLAEVNYEPDVEYEGDDYDHFDVSEHTALSSTDIRGRDELVSEIEQARVMALSSGHRYGSLLEGGAADDEILEEARNQAQLDYELLVDAIQSADDWLDALRGRIEFSIDEVSHMAPMAQDSEVVLELTGWMNSLESMEPINLVEFDQEFDHRNYELEVDLSPLTEMQTETDSGTLHIPGDE